MHGETQTLTGKPSLSDMFRRDNTDQVTYEHESFRSLLIIPFEDFDRKNQTKQIIIKILMIACDCGIANLQDMREDFLSRHTKYKVFPIIGTLTTPDPEHIFYQLITRKFQRGLAIKLLGSFGVLLMSALGTPKSNSHKDKKHSQH